MSKKNIIFSLVLLTVLFTAPGFGKDYKLSSPGGIITVTISVDRAITFSINNASETMVEHAVTGMEMGDLEQGEQPKEISKKYSERISKIDYKHCLNKQ